MEIKFKSVAILLKKTVVIVLQKGVCSISLLMLARLCRMKENWVFIDAQVISGKCHQGQILCFNNVKGARFLHTSCETRCYDDLNFAPGKRILPIIPRISYPQIPAKMLRKYNITDVNIETIARISFEQDSGYVPGSVNFYFVILRKRLLIEIFSTGLAARSNIFRLFKLFVSLDRLRGEMEDSCLH